MSGLLRRACALLCAQPLYSARTAIQIQPERNIHERWRYAVCINYEKRARLLKKQSMRAAPDPQPPRNTFTDWNYDAELHCFSKRLNENFKRPLLQTAFTQPDYAFTERERQRKLGIKAEDMDNLNDNTQLAQRGYDVAAHFLDAYIKYVFPKASAEVHQAIKDYLLSTELLAKVGFGLGMKELLLTKTFPPSDETMAQSLLAVIGALEESSGFEPAFVFVRDFLCTMLNQKDIIELWQPEKPLELVKQVCKERNLGEVEPRQIGEAGRNTVLAAYYVGIYANKKLLGKGFGDSIYDAIDIAAIDSLQGLFDLREERTPINFDANIRDFMQLKYE